MTTMRLDIEYDGTGFSGWAAQPGLRTVQAELEAALATVLREEVKLTVAGRTDAGVHALGQVASFETGAEVPEDLARRLSGIGPPDITVTAARQVEDGFDARRDARSRTYRYRLLARSASSPFERNRALWWPHRIDREALDACAAALPGTHDFTAFTPTQTDHVRFQRNVFQAKWEWTRVNPTAADKTWSAATNIAATSRWGSSFGEHDFQSCECERAGAEYAVGNFVIEADAFMRSMVRILVGTMLEVASSRRSVESFQQLLQGAPRTQAGDTAPAHGLYLESVSYAKTAAG